MRKLFLFSISIISALIMTFCSYSPAVISYIDNEKNYIEIEATVVGTKYYENGYSYLFVTLTDPEHFTDFTGLAYDESDPSLLGTTTVTMKIMQENSNVLMERGFFESINPGDTVTIHTTCWIDGEIHRHYLASIKCQDVEYLTFEEGLEGIKEASTKLKEADIADIFR